jgi:hypothetical protein
MTSRKPFTLPHLPERQPESSLALPAFSRRDLHNLPDSTLPVLWRTFRDVIAAIVPRTGGVYVDDSTLDSDSASDWSSADLALQQGLGVLPERRVGSDRSDPDRARDKWPHVEGL